MTNDITVIWRDSGREPQCAPDPRYPDGVNLDVRTSPDQAGCVVALEYPAKRCGAYIVKCEKCGCTAGITTAGRPDDPKQVTLQCQPPK